MDNAPGLVNVRAADITVQIIDYDANSFTECCLDDLIRPSSSDDLLQRFLYTAVATFQKSNLLDSDAQIRFYPLKTAQRVRLATTTTWLGYDQYVCEVSDTYSKPHYQALALHTVATPTRSTDTVRNDITVTQFVRQLHQHPLLGTLPPIENLPQRQIQRWGSKDQAFRLLDLPAELRNVIYREALRVNQVISINTQGKARRLKLRRPRIRSDGIAHEDEKPTVNLLYANKQVYGEARYILFNDGTFEIPNKASFEHLLWNKPIAESIRNLKLKLTNYEYLKIFGFQVEAIQVETRVTSPIAAALREMNLDKLILDFHPPSPSTDSIWLDNACQFTVVNCILEAAWQWVRGHRLVLTGYIKLRQKIKYEARCEMMLDIVTSWRERNARQTDRRMSLSKFDEFLDSQDDQKDGGVWLEGGPVEHNPSQDFSSHFEGYMADVSFPPPCRCETPCILETWEP